jgi:hypothetical protein
LPVPIRREPVAFEKPLGHADGEPANLDAGIAWVLAQPPADHIDGLLFDYLLGLSHIGPLRFPPARWLPFCEATLETARRHERADSALPSTAAHR